MKKASIRVGVLGFDGINGLDLVGPLEAFAHASYVDSGHAGGHPYEVCVIGMTKKAFTGEAGMRFMPHYSLADAPALDTLVIPGGAGLRVEATTRKVAAWVSARAPRLRRIASVCTGVYGFAPTGLLDGRRVATHWRFAEAVAERFPKLRVDGAALFIKDGPFYTSGGVTAGIDLALALIEEDLGPGAALAVARELLVYVKRPGGQEQYSEPLRFQARAADRYADLVAWIGAHLDHDLSVTALAARAHLSPRQFARRFAAALGSTPADYVERVRLGEARRRLAEANSAIERIALSVGFHSADAFRRAFERRFGIAPSAYRERFGMTAPRFRTGSPALE
ncbi:MAG TPA: helix-turn-helix domain-containing protein [Dokdonella sp.]